jgi:hypothetical protein
MEGKRYKIRDINNYLWFVVVAKEGRDVISIRYDDGLIQEIAKNVFNKLIVEEVLWN